MTCLFAAGDSESRQNLRDMFPDEPETGDALETQQRVLLSEQEESLKKMAKRKGTFLETELVFSEDLGAIEMSVLCTKATVNSAQ